MIDMAMHMMDIVQNGIRANATHIGIAFSENPAGHTLTFRVQDNGAGMNAETIRQLPDPFFTTRTTRRVGLGLPFLKMTCEQTGGGMQVVSEERRGTTVEAVYKTDHPDCLPLGDIAGYLALLLRANPGIRFRFSYAMGSESFTVDSDQLAAQGIDLRTAEMFAAVKAYIHANLKEIFALRPAQGYLC